MQPLNILNKKILQSANRYTYLERPYIRSHTIFDKAVHLVSAIDTEHTVADTAGNAEAGAIEEAFCFFFLGEGIDGITAPVLECLSFGGSAHEGSDLTTQCEFPAAVGVLGVQGKTEFNGSFQVSGSQFVFLEVVGISHIPEGELVAVESSGDIDLCILEIHIVCSEPCTDSDTETGIGFKREIEHEIDVQAAGDSSGIDTVWHLRPAIVTKLDHEVIIGAVAEAYLTPVFFLFCGSGSESRVLGVNSSYTGYSNEQKQKFFHTSLIIDQKYPSRVK